MIKKLRKGFTIIELVIVIAVIAVLTAVLIPTFVHLSKKANKASDNSLVANLNTALKMEESESGKKPQTMHDAVVGLKNQGFYLPQLVTKSDEELVYNLEKNDFCLSGDAEGPSYNYWKICSSKPSEAKWSIYAYKWTGGASVTDLTVGFDAGDESFSEIEYERAGSATDKRSVVIRTNGENPVLTVNAAFDTVDHYAYLDELTVTAIHTESYHEHGVIRQKATISQGHIEIEDGAVVPEVAVESATGTVKVTANEGTLVSSDSYSADQVTVVANSSDVYVSGVSSDHISGPKASEVELPTVVSNESELAAAFGVEKKFIQIGADFAVTTSYTVDFDTLIDFNSHTISTDVLSTIGSEFVDAVNAMDNTFVYVNRPFISSKKSLTLTDTGSNGGVVSSNNNVFINEGTLTVNGGKYTSTCMLHKIFNQDDTTEAQDEYMAGLGYMRGIFHNCENGKLVVNNLDLNVASDYGLINKGVAVINGGNFTSTSNSTNGAAYAYCISSRNDITINNGNIVGQHGCIAINAGKAVINNVHSETRKGTLEKGYFRALYVAGEVAAASAEINGGYFKSYNMEALLTGNKSDGGVGALATTSIKGGTFINGLGGSKPAVVVSKRTGVDYSNYGIGWMTITGGLFSSDVSDANGVITCVQGSDGLWVVNQ